MSGIDKTPSSRVLDLAWRTTFRLGFPLARMCWRLQRRTHEGALVVVTVGRALLLVRSSYRAEWSFPGGSIQHGETPEAAARRELAEEVGLVALSLRPAGIACGVWDGRPDRVHFFTLQLDQVPRLQPDNREIIGTRLVLPGELSGMPLTGPAAAYLARAPLPA